MRKYRRKRRGSTEHVQNISNGFFQAISRWLDSNSGKEKWVCEEWEKPIIQSDLTAVIQYLIGNLFVSIMLLKWNTLEGRIKKCWRVVCQLLRFSSQSFLFMSATVVDYSEPSETVSPLEKYLMDWSWQVGTKWCCWGIQDVEKRPLSQDSCMVRLIRPIR